MKTCTHCQELLPFDAYPRCSMNDKWYYRGKCKKCVNATRRNETLKRHAALPQKPLPAHKVCTKCKRNLPQEAFYLRKATSYHQQIERLYACCKACFSEMQGYERRPESLEEAFRYHTPSGHLDECWIWTGTRTRKSTKHPYSYGVFTYNGTTYRAHRVAYELHTGKTIPPDMQACHICDNPPCVNPAHIFIGTNQDNHADMTSKGRNRVFGTDRKRPAKLTIPQVYTIKQVAYTIRAESLAKLYGVDRHTISSIWRGESWRDIDDLFRQWVTENT